jgi:hypothetical protein
MLPGLLYDLNSSFFQTQSDQVLVLSLNVLTQSDLSVISNAGLLERMEWHVPIDNDDLALGALKLRLDSRLFIYNHTDIKKGHSKIIIKEVYAVKGKNWLINIFLMQVLTNYVYL